MRTSGEKSMICKVPQHILRETIKLPEKKLDENELAKAEEKSEDRESMTSTDAEEIESASSTIEGTTDMLPEKNEGEVTVSSKLSAARVMESKDVATEVPAGNTMWTRVTRWGWKLVLKTCNFHYIALITL